MANTNTTSELSTPSFSTIDLSSTPETSSSGYLAQQHQARKSTNNWLKRLFQNKGETRQVRDEFGEIGDSESEFSGTEVSFVDENQNRTLTSTETFESLRQEFENDDKEIRYISPMKNLNNKRSNHHPKRIISEISLSNATISSSNQLPTETSFKSLPLESLEDFDDKEISGSKPDNKKWKFFPSISRLKSAKKSDVLKFETKKHDSYKVLREKMNRNRLEKHLNEKSIKDADLLWKSKNLPSHEKYMKDLEKRILNPFKFQKAVKYLKRPDPLVVHASSMHMGMHDQNVDHHYLDSSDTLVDEGDFESGENMIGNRKIYDWSPSEPEIELPEVPLRWSSLLSGRRQEIENRVNKNQNLNSNSIMNPDFDPSKVSLRDTTSSSSFWIDLYPSEDKLTKNSRQKSPNKNLINAKSDSALTKFSKNINPVKNKPSRTRSVHKTRLLAQASSSISSSDDENSSNIGHNNIRKKPPKKYPKSHNHNGSFSYKYVRSKKLPKLPEINEYDQVPDEPDAVYIGRYGRRIDQMGDKKLKASNRQDHGQRFLNKDVDNYAKHPLDKMKLRRKSTRFGNTKDPIWQGWKAKDQDNNDDTSSTISNSKCSSFPHLPREAFNRRAGELITESNTGLRKESQGDVVLGRLSRANQELGAYDGHNLHNQIIHDKLLEYQNTKITYDADLSDNEYDDNDLFWAVPLDDPTLDEIKTCVADDIKACLWFSGAHESDDEINSDDDEEQTSEDSYLSKSNDDESYYTYDGESEFYYDEDFYGIGDGKWIKKKHKDIHHKHVPLEMEADGPKVTLGRAYHAGDSKDSLHGGSFINREDNREIYCPFNFNIKSKGQILTEIQANNYKKMRLIQQADKKKWTKQSKNRGIKSHNCEDIRECLAFAINYDSEEEKNNFRTPVITEGIDPFDSDQDFELGDLEAIHVWSGDEEEYDSKSGGKKRNLYGQMADQETLSSENNFDYNTYRSYQTEQSDVEIPVKSIIHPKKESQEIDIQTDLISPKRFHTIEIQTEKIPTPRLPKKPIFPKLQPTIPQLNKQIEQPFIDEPIKPAINPLLRLQIMRGDFILDDHKIADKTNNIMSSHESDSSQNYEESFIPYFPDKYTNAVMKDQAEKLIKSCFSQIADDQKQAEKKARILPQRKVKIDSIQRRKEIDTAVNVLSFEKLIKNSFNQIHKENELMENINQAYKETNDELNNILRQEPEERKEELKKSMNFSDVVIEKVAEKNLLEQTLAVFKKMDEELDRTYGVLENRLNPTGPEYPKVSKGTDSDINRQVKPPKQETSSIYLSKMSESGFDISSNLSLSTSLTSNLPPFENSKTKISCQYHRIIKPKILQKRLRKNNLRLQQYKKREHRLNAVKQNYRKNQSIQKFNFHKTLTNLITKIDQKAEQKSFPVPSSNSKNDDFCPSKSKNQEKRYKHVRHIVQIYEVLTRNYKLHHPIQPVILGQHSLWPKSGIQMSKINFKKSINKLEMQRRKKLREFYLRNMRPVRTNKSK